MRKKIILSLFVLFIFLSLGTATAIIYMSGNIADLKNIIVLHEVEQLRRSLVIRIQNVQSDLYTVDTVFAHDLDFIVNEIRELDSVAQKCSTCHHTPKLEHRIAEVQNLLQDYKMALSYYITATADSARIQTLKIEASAIGDRVLQLTSEMSHSASRNLEELTNENVARMDYVRIILYGTIAITFILGGIVAVYLTRFVTRPVNELVKAARMISTGNLGATVSYKDDTEFGELAENFNAMSITINEGYKKIEKEIEVRQQTEEALRESESNLQSVFKEMQDVFYRTDMAGKIKWMSPSAVVMFKYESVDELIGQEFSSLFTSQRKVQDFFEALSVKDKVTNYEIDMRCNDGTIIVASVNSHFYMNSEGEIAGMEGSCRDITELKKIEEERVKIQKLESVGILAGGIAHDFNNILTSILTNITLARLLADSKERVEEILNKTEAACKNASKLTYQLLTFAKGGTPVKKIAYITRLLTESVNFTLRGSNVDCEIFIPDDLWPVEIDEGQINQVILNLVINAKQAMPEGGIIYINAENVAASAGIKSPMPDEDSIKISFIDSGVGISEENIGKIFDPYFTTKEHGTGLGLASTYSIIKKHDGYIEVESRESDGTKVHIYLPAVKGHVPVDYSKLGEIVKGIGKILLMDDDPYLRTSVGRALSNLGYEVYIASDGAEAIELYNIHKASVKPFDIVIMDLTIRGGMGGREALQMLRKLDPEVKAIVSSGYFDDSVMANYKEHGFCGVITKPYEIHELSMLLRELIS